MSVPEGTVIFAGETAEPRSKSTSTVADREQIPLVTVALTGTSQVTIGGRSSSLRNVEGLAEAMTAVGAKHYLVDVTGLPHGVWAALLRAAWLTDLPVWACYVEPAEYSFSRVPTQGTPFDLSLSIAGLEPLPGFARLARRDAEPVVIPLLGFEGARFGYLLEQLEALPEDVVPVIGAPGFRIEYPLFAFVGNRRPLTESESFRRTRYATANDPFDLFFLLESLREESGPERPFLIAPIGTKPHAVGAALYFLHEQDVNPGRVELVYDHPERNPRRTQGQSRLLLYYVDEFRTFLHRRDHAVAGDDNGVL